MQFRHLAMITLVATSLSTTGRAAPDLMGYFDAEILLTDFRNSDALRLEQHRLATMIQHEVDRFKFFTEVEYKYSPAWEDKWNGKGHSSWGGFEVERAWSEVTLLDQTFVLRIGKSESPTLWDRNHYPNLRLPIQRPMLVDSIFKSAFTGLQLTWHHGNSLEFTIWGNKGAPSTTDTGGVRTITAWPEGISSGAKILGEAKINDGSLSAGAVFADYNDLPARRQARGLELELNWRQLKLWSQFATSDGSTGWYSILSWTFPSGSSEITPFWHHDSLKNGDQTDAAVLDVLGVDFKPLPEIAWKLCFNFNRSANGNDAFSGASTSFVYFFD